MFQSVIRIFILFFCVALWSQSKIEKFTLKASKLGYEKQIWVYLPKSYGQLKKKFPVIYMHDAQNLFDAKTSFVGEWNVDETLDSLNAEVIVVGIEHGNEKRIDELTPFVHEKYGGGKANAYLDFIVKQVKPKIDSIYKTKPQKKHTAIWGSSLGGLVSIYASIVYPDVFGKVGCFSPAFWINKKEIFELLKQQKKYDCKVYLLCGNKEDAENSMEKDMKEAENIINTLRCECKKNNKSKVIINGQHNEKLWRENFAEAFLWLF